MYRNVTKGSVNCNGAAQSGRGSRLVESRYQGPSLAQIVIWLGLLAS